jgi:hypothetical protein
MRFYRAFAALPLFVAFVSPANAQVAQTSAETASEVAAADPPSAPATKTTEATDASKEWEFSTVTYLWAASVHGDSDISPLPTADVDLKFSKVLKNLKFAFMGAAEARHDRLIFLGDLMWTHLGASEGVGVRDPDFLKAKLDLKTLAVTGLAGYRVANEGPVVVDLFAGGRVNNSTTELKLAGPNREARAKVSETWVDPVIATRLFFPAGGKFGVTLYGDIGGVLWGSDFSWQGVATVDYRLSHKMMLAAGWRYFKVNYDTHDFRYNIAQSGPILGLRYTF